MFALSVIQRALTPSSSTSELPPQWDVGKTGAGKGLCREQGPQRPPTTLPSLWVPSTGQGHR